MNNFYIEDLNCYYNAVFSIMNTKDIPLTPILYNIGSEYDLYYDKFSGYYLCNCIHKNLEDLGIHDVRHKTPSYEEKDTLLNKCELHEWIIIGMDCFDIPWHPFYQLARQTHYFPMYKDSLDTFCGMDPMYSKTNLYMSKHHICTFGFDLRLFTFHVNLSYKTTRCFNYTATSLAFSQVFYKLNNQLSNPFVLDDLIKIPAYINAIIGSRTLFFYYIKNEFLPACNIFFEDDSLEELQNLIIVKWKHLIALFSKIIVLGSNPSFVGDGIHRLDLLHNLEQSYLLKLENHSSINI